MERNFVRVFTVILVLSGYTGTTQKLGSMIPAIQKPNFLFIISDDQRYNAVHALGDSMLHTPNLDRLVHEGTTFTHAYNMGAWHGAVCVASRTMLLTGLTVWKARDAEPDLDNPSFQDRMWPRQLSDAGYETYMAGKWHVKVPVSTLFQHVLNVRPGMANDSPQGYDRPQNKNDTLWQPWNMQFGGYWRGGKHWSEVLADDGIGFIKEAAKKEKPFFMYLAFNAPHDPRQSPKEYVDMYPPQQVRLPDSYQELYPYKDSIGCGPNLRDEKLAPFPRTPFAIRTHIREYYALTSHMDHQLGRIINALEESGDMDNTYIIFTSDHGLALGHHGLMGKQNLYDHSIRVPLIIKGPGIGQNQKLSQQVYLQDIMPTTLEMAGIQLDSSIHFASLVPYLKGIRKQNTSTSIYGCYMDLQRMVRTDRYKLIAYPRAQKILLFDLLIDPAERNDISADPEYKSIVRSLIDELQRQQKVMNDPLDLSAWCRKMIASHNHR